MSPALERIKGVAQVTVSGGVYTISTGDDAFHADEALTVSAREINILTSYEGLEGTSVSVSGGTIYIVSSDDGVSAAGGADGSGFGGFGRGTPFGGNSGSLIHISGGYLVVRAGGDGLDSNGNAIMSGGTVIVSSTGQGDGALDYDGSFTLSGGILLAADSGAYRRWLAVFAVLAFGLFLLAKWAFMGHSSFYFTFAEQWWYPVWVMAVGLALSLYWFRRHGQKNGTISKWLVLALVVVLVFGVGTMAWNWHVFDSSFLDGYAEVYPLVIPWQVILQRELIINGGVVCALIALAGLILAKCYDRRWLALYTLAVTVAAVCGFIIFFCRSIDIGYAIRSSAQSYLFARLIPIGAVGLIGTGVALC